MRNWILFGILIFLLGVSVCKAQYKWTGKSYNEQYRIPHTQQPYDKIYYKGFGDRIRLYLNLYDSNSLCIVSKDIQLPSLKSLTVDTIKIANLTNYSDILPLPNNDIVVAWRKAFLYDRKRRHIDTIRLNNFRFARASPINDSLVLLYDIYKYHPASGFAGLHFGILNLHTLSVVKSKQYAFPGIVLSHIQSGNWVTTTHENIYVIEPLSGHLTKFNLALEPVESFNLPVRWVDSLRNKQFLRQTDSFITTECKRLNGYIQSYGLDSVLRNRALVESPAFSKEFVSDALDTVHTRLEYIEKIMPYSDSVIIFTISKPTEKSFHFRDLLFYNVFTKKTVRFIPDWLTGQADMPEKIEDFFSVDLIVDIKSAPYLWQNKVYYRTFYNPDLYTNTTRDSLEKIYFIDTKKNDYKWSLLEYSF